MLTPSLVKLASAVIDLKKRPVRHSSIDLTKPPEMSPEILAQYRTHMNNQMGQMMAKNMPKSTLRNLLFNYATQRLAGVVAPRLGDNGWVPAASDVGLSNVTNYR